MKIQELLEARKEKGMSPELIDSLNDKANGADEVEHEGKKYRRAGPKNAVSQPGKWEELFNYRDVFGVNIRKVHFTSGLAGPKHGKPEDRSGNFHYLTKEQDATHKKLKADGWYMHNGWCAGGKEFTHPTDNSKGQDFWKEISIFVKNGEKGAMAVLPSGKMMKVQSKSWKPELKDFKE